MRKIRVYILSIFVFATMWASAQKEEVGVFIGASNYQGDLAPDIAWGESHFAVGINYKRNINPFFSYSLNFNYGQISGNDKNFSYLKTRNLNFSSDIMEFSPRIEFNFFNYGVGLHPKRFTPYVFTGLNVFKFSPKTTVNGIEATLRNIGTEGQLIDKKNTRQSYGTYSMSIPIGLGMRLQFTDKLSLYAHGEFMYSFTDYLDDVKGTYADKDKLNKGGAYTSRLADRSGETTNIYLGTTGKQRGNPQTADWYIFTGLTVSYMIPNLICFQF